MTAASMLPVLAAAAESGETATGIASAGVPAAGTPADLAWLIPVIPALSAALLLLFGRRLGRLSAAIAITAVGASATIATLVFVQLLGLEESERVLVTTVGTWISSGELQVDWALLIDPLSSIMSLLVTWVGLLIHIYSLGYMHDDDGYARFFAYLNLFVAAMLVLVFGSSLLTLFVGWEGVGLASYLLIGFWFERRDYASAAKKAFILNRIGDVGFMIAMFVVFQAFGSLAFADILTAPRAVLGTGAAVAIGLLLFAAASGKSAQIPLYVWLPDAMAGPTPVSALIHAATMVTAGVYLVARMSPIYAIVPDVGLFIAYVGVATALLAALIACVQNDLKKVLAYSTVSQLGYMFVAVGLGSQVAGIFHLLTHGFFKALLFLAAGSVMHAMANRTDVWGMGGLRKAMPITFVTSVIAWLAIAGIFPFSGFWSKEEVLVAALDTPGAFPIWVIGTFVAFLTAFYMSRWMFLIFFGRQRFATTGTDAVHPHESPLSMTLPLVALAVAAAVGGALEYPPGEGFLHGWLEPVVVPFVGDAPFLEHALAQALVIAAGVVGIALAYVVYLRRAIDVEAVRARAGGAYGFALNKFYVDELYTALVLVPGRYLADGFARFDTGGIDGAVNGSATLTRGLAAVGRRLQTGLVRTYALAVMAGAVVVVLLFALAGGAAALGGS